MSSVTSSSSQLLWIKALVSALQDEATLDVLSGMDDSSEDSWYDILDLSSEGQDAANRVYETLAASTVTRLQASASSAGAALQKDLAAALAANGVDTSEEIDLQVDSGGDVVVSNDASQAETIEDTINGDTDLKKAVTQYTRFLQAVAPTLENAASSQVDSTSALAYFTQLGEDLASAKEAGDLQDTITLALQDDAFQALSVDSSDNSIVLVSLELD